MRHAPGTISLSHLATLFVAGIFVAFLFPVSVHAQQSSAGAKIAPAIIENRIEPGESFSGTITVTNLEDVTRTLRVFTVDIKSITEGGSPVFADEGEITGYELSQWIKPSVDEVTLEPGGETKVNFTVSVPPNASPGGHFGGIFFSADPERHRITGASVGYQLGTIMNFRIGGNIIEDAQIREFITDKTIYSKPNVQFALEVENQGNVLIRPRGTIDITDMFGNKAGVVRLNDSGGAVLPESRRTFTTSWEGDGFMFGRYEALAAILYGEDGRKTMSAAMSFWILPLNIILPVAGGLLAIILVIYFGMKFYVRRRLDEMYRHTRPMQGRDMRQLRSTRTMDRSRAPMPKLAVVAIAVLVFTMIFLAILFLFFA